MRLWVRGVHSGPPDLLAGFGKKRGREKKGLGKKRRGKRREKEGKVQEGKVGGEGRRER